MISGLKCSDIQREYYDIIDEIPIFNRKEECTHYEIKIKRRSEKSIFQQFDIKLVCKQCKDQINKSLNSKKNKFEYECLKCKYPPISFCYEYLQSNEPETFKKKNCLEDKSDIFETNIKTNIETKDETHIAAPLGIEGYIQHNNINEEIQKSSIVNEDYKKEKEEKIMGARKEKRFFTPNDLSDNSQTKNKSNQKKQMIYYTPPNDSKSINKSNIKLDASNTINAPNMIKITIMYNNQEELFEFNSLETIRSQYYKIKERFNFDEFKPLISNSKNKDLDKSFFENQISNGFILEID